MAGLFLKRAMEVFKQSLRIGGWFLAWGLLFLTVFAIAYPLRNGLRVERALVIFAMAWGGIAMLSMALLWRMRRPRARWLLIALVLLAVSLGGFVAVSGQDASRRNDTDDWRAPSFDKAPWRQRLRDLRLRPV